MGIQLKRFKHYIDVSWRARGLTISSGFTLGAVPIDDKKALML